MTALADTTALRQEIIATCHRMVQAGLVTGTAGNISVRVQDGLLMTPSALPYDQMTPDRICKLSLTDAPAADASPKPTTEWAFHQAVMQARPDVTAVVHAHPPYATAIATQRRKIEAVHYMVAVFGGADVPLVDYARYGSPALAKGVAAAMLKRDGCLMANHGALAAGNGLDQALWRMQELENLARIDTYARIGGTPVLLSEADIAEVLASFSDYKPR
jgi:L-fuculose-phosphate aldolase